MKQILQFFFWPNPPSAAYSSPKVILLFAFSILLIAGSYFFNNWRRKHADVMFKKLSASWPTAMFWFGVTALIMTFSRTEGISFLAMRILWVVWAIALILYIILQMYSYRMRYFQLVPVIKKKNPLQKYLPKKK